MFCESLASKKDCIDRNLEIQLDTLREHNLSIMDCWGQMTTLGICRGKYQGLQARIKEVNPLAEYVPCSAYSLNLVGSCAAECCVNAISFLEFLQTLFNFVPASTLRWRILKSTHGVVIKSLSITRWSARSDTTHALNALIQLAEDEDQATPTRSDASSLVSKMQDFEISLLCVLWDKILKRFDATSKTLQKIEIELATCVHFYESLLEFVRSLRNDKAFENFEEMTKY